MMYLINMRIETKDKQGNKVIHKPGDRVATLPKGEVERLIRLGAVEALPGEKQDRKGEGKEPDPPDKEPTE